MTPDQLAISSKLREWRADALRFAVECVGFAPDPWQERAFEAASVSGRKRIAMKACAGPGKTAVEAVLGWHRLACFGDRGEHPKGAAVSITGDNLRDNLWPELAKWQARSKFLTKAFTWTKERVFANDHPETWFLSARTYAQGADQETIGRTLSGMHSRFPFYLIDESGDMPPQISRSAEQGLTDCEDGLIITGGNTTSHNGLLYHVAGSDRAGWTIITITADPDDPQRTPRVDKAWAQEQIDKYGRENPWVMAYILGQFPPTSINALLSVDEVEAAMVRHYREDSYGWAQKRLGIDVARFGDDRSVIFPRQGLVAGNPAPVIMRVQRTTDIAARVGQIVAQWRSEAEFVDDTGHWGHGVIDNLLAARVGNPQGIQFHGAPLNPRYKNRRAEMWFEMADWVKRGGALPNMPELVGELATPTYTFVGGKVQLEDKDLIKKRLGRSPDLADALALTFAMPDQPARLEVLPGTIWGNPARVIHDYNPLED